MILEKMWALDDLRWFILTFFRTNLVFFDHNLLINIDVRLALLSWELLDIFYYNSFLVVLTLLKNESKLSPNEVSRFALTFSFSQSKALKKCVTEVSTNDIASQKIYSSKILWTFSVVEFSFFSPKFLANDISSREIVRKIRNLAEKLENPGIAFKIIYFKELKKVFLTPWLRGFQKFK